MMQCSKYIIWGKELRQNVVETYQHSRFSNKRTEMRNNLEISTCDPIYTKWTIHTYSTIMVGKIHHNYEKGKPSMRHL